MPEKNPNLFVGLVAALYAGAIALVYTMQNKNIAKCATSAVCDERTKNLGKSIEEGKAESKDQWKVLTDMKELLIETHTIVKNMEKNYHKRKEDD